MTVVALTGGIASGKSTVLEMLASLGATCIDADDVARDVVAPGSPALRELASAFGPEIIADGQLNRPALAQRVFSDDGARQRLNSIVHPRVRERTTMLIETALRKDPESLVVYAIPLLVEAGSDYQFDAVIAVSASEEVRIGRLVENRGMTLDDARARVAAQANESDRLAIADYVIDTNGSLEATRQQVLEIWAKLSSA